MDERTAWLRVEVRAWEAEGLVTPAQASAILERYPETPPLAVDRTVAGRVRSSGRIVVAISILGATLLGLGVILFFASNWDATPRTLRVVLLFGVTAATYFGGYELEFRRRNYPKVGHALAFLGALFYGASIFLTAQMFHVNERALDDLLLLWLAGTLPLAYVLRNAFTSALNLVLLTVWANFQIVEADPSPTPQAFAMLNVAMGAAFYALGKTHANAPLLQRHAPAYRYLGALLAATAMFVLTFDFDQRDVETASGLAALLLVVVAAVALGLALFAHARGRATDSSSALETVTLGVVAALPLAFLLVPALADDLVMNVALASFLVALLVIGYRSFDVNLVNLTLLMIAIDIVARYFDFFYDLLPRSFFFMAGGALLLAGALVGERQRRKLVARMRAEAHA